MFYEIIRSVTGTDTRFCLYLDWHRTVISVWDILTNIAGFSFILKYAIKAL